MFVKTAGKNQRATFYAHKTDRGHVDVTALNLPTRNLHQLPRVFHEGLELFVEKLFRWGSRDTLRTECAIQLATSTNLQVTISQMHNCTSFYVSGTTSLSRYTLRHPAKLLFRHARLYATRLLLHLRLHLNEVARRNSRLQQRPICTCLPKYLRWNPVWSPDRWQKAARLSIIHHIL